MKEEIINIFIAIKKSGMTQGEVVRRAGLSSETRLSRILKGYSEPTQEEMKKILKVLNLKESEHETLNANE